MYTKETTQQKYNIVLTQHRNNKHAICTLSSTKNVKKRKTL